VVATVLALPPVGLVLFDLSRRGAQMLRFGAGGAVSYAVALAEALLLWGAVLVVASRRRGALRHVAAVALVVLATITLGAQRYFHGQFATYLNLDAALFGAGFSATVVKLLRADMGAVMRVHAAPLVASVLVLLVARRLLRPRRSEARLAQLVVLPALAAAAFLPCSFRALQAATPDIIYLHAMGGLARQRLGLQIAEAAPGSLALPGTRTPEYMPALVATPAAPRSVVFVLTESVRADAVCGAFDPACKRTPFSNAAAPERIPLSQMRANDSTTAVSVAVLLTGASPAASRDELHRAPMVWEYARAAGWDTAYWTSQDLRFGNSDLFVRDIGASHRVSGAELDPDADLDLGADDGRLSEHVAARLGGLREPFFAVVHFANTHFPYRVDPARSPFQPSEFTKDPDRSGAFLNHYRNAVFRQDAAVGRLIDAVRASPAGPRTVIVYTSDHGEAFREHAQLGHTVSVYDEEIRVPFWVDAPEGTLAPSERQSLAAARDRFAFHTDALPTFLDLMGVWEAPETARFRGRLLGQSLLRPAGDARAVPLTNCAAVWGCPFKNWGLMRGPLKLEARQWDPGWHCWDVLADPGERRDLGAAACGDLAGQASSVFGGPPGGSR
jgi:glucan phosphoethanolaminetransferase (alkaline phosphatase superfamily)